MINRRPQEARRPWAWLIFDGGQKRKKGRSDADVSGDHGRRRPRNPRRDFRLAMRCLFISREISPSSAPPAKKEEALSVRKLRCEGGQGGSPTSFRAKGPTRRQSQRPRPSCLVLTKEESNETTD